MEPKGSLLEFPCSFPLKVMGRQAEDFEALVLALVRQHTPEADVESVSRQASREGKYLSVTITLTARSQAQLDAIYLDLHAEKRVVMTL